MSSCRISGSLSVGPCLLQTDPLTGGVGINVCQPRAGLHVGGGVSVSSGSPSASTADVGYVFDVSTSDDNGATGIFAFSPSSRATFSRGLALLLMFSFL